MLDVDVEADSNGAQGAATARQHSLPKSAVLPLPLSEPSAYTVYNEYSQGQLVLALYPDTTCFYRAYVHSSPSMTPPNAQGRRDYLIEFEDENESSGRSEPMRVPQKYVLRTPNTHM